MKEVNVENGKVVLKNFKNFFHIEYIDYKVPQAENAATVKITAPSVSGYNFVCWIGVASHNFVRSCYIDIPDSVTADIWFTQSTMDIGEDSNRVTAYALYVKD